MKKTLKIAALILAIVFVVCAFAACGASGNNGDSNEADQTSAVKGETKTWGYFSVLVPEGYSLKGGDILDENDVSKCSVSKDDSMLTYMNFSVVDAETATNSLATTKEMNSEHGAADVTVDANGTTWTGVAYDAYGTPCFQGYATIGDNTVLITSAGNEYSSDIMNAVLASITVTVPAE